MIQLRPENLNNIGSFLNPIAIKIFEEDSDYLKMNLNLKYFTNGLEKTIITVHKSIVLEEFKDVLKEAFVFKNLKINFYDLQKNEIDSTTKMSELPENNEFYVEVNGDVISDLGHIENIK